MTNFHILKVKYLPPTNHRGSWVKIISDRFKQSVTVPFDHTLNNIEDMALPILQERGFNIVGLADGYVITDTFLPLKLSRCEKCKQPSNRLSGVNLCPPCTTEWAKA